MEIDRFYRYKHPFTVAYIDLDNFKTVNDQFGHATEDDALCTVATYAKNINMQCRTTQYGRVNNN